MLDTSLPTQQRLSSSKLISSVSAGQALARQVRGLPGPQSSLMSFDSATPSKSGSAGLQLRLRAHSDSAFAQRPVLNRSVLLLLVHVYIQLYNAICSISHCLKTKSLQTRLLYCVLDDCWHTYACCRQCVAYWRILYHEHMYQDISFMYNGVVQTG